MRREFALVLLLGAVGAGLVVLAARQAWAQAIFTPPRPLPPQDISVTGQQLVPLAGALALAGLACLAAVIATRSWARRVAGALLAALGAGAVVAAGAGVSAAAVLATARADALAGALGGSTTSGTSPGGTPHGIVIAGSAGQAVITGASWQAAAICGAVAIVLAGLATVWRGPRWPVMGARFQGGSGGMGSSQGGSGGMGSSQGGSGGMGPPRRSSGGSRGVVPPEDMWESLNRDLDPTAEDDAVPQSLEDQLGGGS
ncbi:MAG TPA: Trp biosynthesis-associated membrane protein [Streptosporangiaceae bacterium]